MLSMLMTTVANIINSVIARVGVDKDLALKLTTEINKELITVGSKELQGSIDIILAEANGKSWLQRNCRPLFMMTIIAVIINNYIIYPYLHIFGLPVVTIDLPEKLYSLMEICVGGYVVGRTGEKMIETWTRK